MVFDRFGLAQPHNKCISKAATCHANSTVQAASNNIFFFKHIICTENVTAVRYTLQRLQMCSRATIASSTWNKYQLIDNFYSLLAASICCHRGRCRCDTVIHACTRGLSLNEKKMNCDTVVIHACTRGLSFEFVFFNFCVRSSGACPRHIAKDCCCG